MSMMVFGENGMSLTVGVRRCEERDDAIMPFFAVAPEIKIETPSVMQRTIRRSLRKKALRTSQMLSSSTASSCTSTTSTRLIASFR